VPDDGRFYSVRLHPDRLVVFVSRSHAWASRRSIHLHDLVEQRLILREPGSATRSTFEQALAEQQITLHNTLEIGSREGVREAVAASLGVGVVSAKELGHDNRLHALQVRDAELQATEYAACLAERRPLRVLRAFFELIETR
jgi:DNA-binding transcriptional LysR family regulator